MFLFSSCFSSLLSEQIVALVKGEGVLVRIIFFITTIFFFIYKLFFLEAGRRNGCL